MKPHQNRTVNKITACTMDCPDACSLIASSDETGSVRLRGNPDDPVTAGFTCVKIKGHIKRLQSPQRVLRPMLRVAGVWQVIGWDDALDLCAEKIQALRKEPKAILHIQGDGAKGVLKKATSLFFTELGSSRIWGSLCDAAGIMACTHDFGSRKNNDVIDLLNAAKIINWGKDLARSSVHTAALVRQARKIGTKVITISPGGDGNAGFSDEHVQIRPGTDRFLAAAVIRLFSERGRIRRDIMNHTKKPDNFISMILAYPLDRLLSNCEVSYNDLERVFQFYASEEPTATLVGAGLQRYKFGGENVRFINALALISGNIGLSGGGCYFQLHSYRNLNLEWVEGTQRKPRRSFPISAIGQEILAAQDPPVKMIWINGSNVINQAPDSRHIIRAFEQVDFKVVVDAFMNDTAQRADLILPSRLMLEQEDIIGSYLHEYVRYVSPVLEAPGETRDDFWILTQVGKRLNPPLILPDPEGCLRKSVDSSFLDVTLEQLRRQKSARSNRSPIAYPNLQFDHRDGKYRFPLVLHKEPPPPLEYPLRLLTLVRRNTLHSQILPEHQKQPPDVWVASDCPQLANLDLNRDVFIVSPLARLKVSVQTLPDLHPGAVLYRRGDWMSEGGGANQLVAAGLTDIGSGAPFYEQYVRLENS